MSDGPSDSRGVYQCPFCKIALLLLLDAGFAFVRSQIVMHLDRCPDRPEDVGREEVNRLAEDATTVLTGC